VKRSCPRSIAAHRASERGSVLLLAVVLTAVMATVAAFSTTGVMFQHRMSARSEDYLSALAIAEAGAEKAMRELNAPDGYAAWTDWTDMVDSKSIQETVTGHAGSTEGEVFVTVSNVGTSSPTITATGYIPNRDEARLIRTIHVEGIANSNTTPNMVTTPSPFGGFGIYSRSTITLNGNNNNIDSYTSMQDVNGDGAADYVPYNTTPAGGSLNRGSNGNLGSNNGGNSTGNGITMNGAPNSVAGNVQSRGGILRNPVNGNPVTGQIIPYSAPTAPPPFPSADYTAAQTTNNNPAYSCSNCNDGGIRFTQANGAPLQRGQSPRCIRPGRLLPDRADDQRSQQPN
jgi:hypothetical protein